MSSPLIGQRQLAVHSFAPSTGGLFTLFITSFHFIAIFILRFDPSFFSVRERVRAGDLGHVHMIKVMSKSKIKCYSMLEALISSRLCMNF